MAGATRRPRRGREAAVLRSHCRRERQEGSQLNCRRRLRERRQQRDWSDLPNPALFSILQRLPTFRDLFAFDGVCRAWRAVSGPALPGLISSQPPLLCAAGGHHFYSFPNRRFYRSALPGLSRPDAVLLGFSHGYLVMADAGFRWDLWLVNPFTGHEVVSIPPLHRAHAAEWAVLTASTASPGCLLVAWCRLTIAYWKPGDLFWSVYWCETDEERACSRWPIVVEGAVYARNLHGKLLRFEFAPRPTATRVGARDLLPGATNVWLVASGGQILAIHANLGSVGEESLAVYRLDCSAGEWVRMETLGGRALLFTSIGVGLCDDDPAKWGGEGNCIYYQGPPGREVRVFGMEGSRAEAVSVRVDLPSSHLERKCCCLGMCCSSFIWVLPRLCY